MISRATQHLVILAACMEVATATLPLQQVLFSEEVAASYGARCLDGSPAGYYLRTVEGSRDWVFYLQGGGLCIEAYDCLQRSKTTLGSSKLWKPTYVDNSNLLNDNPEENPFAGFNAVYFPYCSGDTYLGTKKDKNLFLGNLFTNGHLILEAALDHLHNTTSMQSGVDRALLTGGSAGGIGALHNADWLAQTITEKFGFGEAVVKAAPQAGLFFPSQPSAGVCVFKQYNVLGEACPRLDIFESWYVRHAEHAFEDRSCARKLDDKSRCWDAGILARYVTTPLFFAQNRYDSNQIQNEMLCRKCTDNASAMSEDVRRYMRYFGNHTEMTLRDLAGTFGHSVFMPNCYSHTQNLQLTSSISIDGQTFMTALKDWFFKGVQHAHFDGCGDLPCSPNCHTISVPLPLAVLV